MAVDEVLLDEAASGEGLVLRTYAWAEPTLSIGYFQDASERLAHPASLACPLVRRLTGGGAIVHDRELTYSVVLPADDPLARTRERLYREFHESLIECLADWSIEAMVWGKAGEASPAPFLCFQRRTELDVVLGPGKIAGSAQRRRRAAVLQHGSILLQRSTAAPELPGLYDLSSCRIEIDQFADAWLHRLSVRLGWSWRPWELGAVQRDRVERAKERYLHPSLKRGGGGPAS